MADHPSDKNELAEWMGTTVEEMDAVHDALHEKICSCLGIKSYSLAVRDGEELTHDEWCVANFEEEAILNVQRWLHQGAKLLGA